MVVVHLCYFLGLASFAVVVLAVFEHPVADYSVAALVYHPADLDLLADQEIHLQDLLDNLQVELEQESIVLKYLKQLFGPAQH